MTKKFLIPLLMVFLLLTLGGFLLNRVNETKFLYQNDNKFKIPSFKARDLNGNTITEDIFMGKFTVICLWVTKDEENSRQILECINNLKNTAPAPLQIIGIVGDVRENADNEQIAAARKIATVCHDTPQITVNDDLTELLKRIRNAPTVFFIDDEGNIIGQPVVGNEPLLVEKEAARLMRASTEYGKAQERAQNIIFYKP